MLLLADSIRRMQASEDFACGIGNIGNGRRRDALLAPISSGRHRAWMMLQADPKKYADWATQVTPWAEERGVSFVS